MKSKIPAVKKKIASYILGEDGKISKQALIKVGAILGTAALSSILISNNVVAGHTSHTLNALTLHYDEGAASAVHSHHASHSSY